MDAPVAADAAAMIARVVFDIMKVVRIRCVLRYMGYSYGCLIDSRARLLIICTCRLASVGTAQR